MFIRKCVFVIASLFFVANFPLTAGRLGEKDDTSQESEKSENPLRKKIHKLVKSKTANGNPIYIREYYGYVFVPHLFPPTYNKIGERPFHLAKGHDMILVDLLVPLVTDLYDNTLNISLENHLDPLIESMCSYGVEKNGTLEDIQGKGEHGTLALLKNPNCPYERHNLLTAVLQEHKKK